MESNLLAKSLGQAQGISYMGIAQKGWVCPYYLGGYPGAFPVHGGHLGSLSVVCLGDPSLSHAYHSDSQVDLSLKQGIKLQQTPGICGLLHS